MDPVTSEDVVATWKLLTDKSLQDPAQTLIYSNFEPPVAESKYIVSVKAKTQNWQNLLYFGNSMLILPAHLLKSVNGAAYIRDYNYKMMPGTGPYIITEQDVNKGNSVRIRKRTDYWSEKDRRNVGLNNFATINQQVVRDENLEFERVKRGDLDLFVLTARPAVGPGAGLPRHQARPQPEAKGLQQQPERDPGCRHEHAPRAL